MPWPRPMIGNADRGPVLKVSKRADQSIVRLVLRSHGKAKDNWSGWCSFVTKRERDWVKQSANKTEIFTDSWINLGLQACNQRGTMQIGTIQGFQ